MTSAGTPPAPEFAAAKISNTERITSFAIPNPISSLALRGGGLRRGPGLQVLDHRRRKLGDRRAEIVIDQWFRTSSMSSRVPCADIFQRRPDIHDALRGEDRLRTTRCGWFPLLVEDGDGVTDGPGGRLSKMPFFAVVFLEELLERRGLRPGPDSAWRGPWPPPPGVRSPLVCPPSRATRPPLPLKSAAPAAPALRDSALSCVLSSASKDLTHARSGSPAWITTGKGPLSSNSPPRGPVCSPLESTGQAREGFVLYGVGAGLCEDEVLIQSEDPWHDSFGASRRPSSHDMAVGPPPGAVARDAFARKLGIDVATNSDRDAPWACWWCC